MTWILIKLLIRVVVFTAVFYVAVRKSEKITVDKKWAVPLVGLVFALLNTGLYWLLKPVINLATFGVAWLVVPFLLNGVFLYATNWLLGKAKLKGLQLSGTWIMIKLAVLVTVVHGGLYLILDVLAK